MPKKFSKDVTDAVGALDREGIAVKEIMRRLNIGEAGLDHKVPISERAVYDLRAKFYADEGVQQLEQDAAAHSVAALKKLARDRVAREIVHLTKKPLGKLAGKPATDLHQLYIKADDMERRELLAQKRTGRSLSKPSGNDQPESAVERLAREANEPDDDPNDLQGA